LYATDLAYSQNEKGEAKGVITLTGATLMPHPRENEENGFKIVASVKEGGRTYHIQAEDRKSAKAWIEAISMTRGILIEKSKGSLEAKAEKICAFEKVMSLYHGVECSSKPTADMHDSSRGASEGVRAESPESKSKANNYDQFRKAVGGDLMKSLWKAVDEDADGYLEPSESIEALRICFDVHCKAYEACLLDQMEAYYCNLPPNEMDCNLLDLTRECARKVLPGVLKQYKANIMTKDVYNRLHARMDKNKDGNVDESEFCEGFIEALASILAPFRAEVLRQARLKIQQLLREEIARQRADGDE